jgi:hypothetical protein
MTFYVFTILYNWTDSGRRLALDYRNGAVAEGTVPKNSSRTDDTTEGHQFQGGICHQLVYLRSIRELRVSGPWRPNFPQIPKRAGQNSGAN